MHSQWEIVRRGTVFVHPRSDPYARDADRNFNHVPNVVLMPDNRLLTVWFSGPWEGHHWQALLASSSSDGGNTWSGGRVLQDTHGSPDFNPAFVRDGDRVWLFFSYCSRYAQLFDQEAERLGSWARYTDDSGRTWSEAVHLCTPEISCSNGIVLGNGDLLVGVGALETGVYVLKSADGGMSWRKYGGIVTLYSHAEPTIVELKDGSLLMFIRNMSGYVWQSRSMDGGETWSRAEQTDLVGNWSSHCLYRLRGGEIALAYNPCEHPMARTDLVIRFSRDEARTWSDPIKLDEIALTAGTPADRLPYPFSQGRAAVTYPSLAENADGDLVVVWARYWVTDDEHCGDICFAQMRPTKAHVSTAGTGS